MTVHKTSPIAITMGDPGGVGGELAIKAWLSAASGNSHPFFLIDDPRRVSDLLRRFEIDKAIEVISTPGQASECFQHRLPIIPITVPKHNLFGKGDPANADAVVASIDHAISFCRAGSASAMVTNPIHKASLYEANFSFPGHTEYLAHRCASSNEALAPVMMLTCPGLRVVLATIHMPLRQVAECLTKELIIETARITSHALQQDFGIESPRISVAALNPHAGEDGALGSEEIQIIRPAIDQLKLEGVDVVGPYPADTLFHAEARTTYDAVLCMYHDQALIPLKSLDFYGGVNVTLGLPIVRTSPDHGTAFDIAGSNTANPSSLINAIEFAGSIAQTRRAKANVT